MQTKIEKAYNELVELRYQLYDRLFLTLPLDTVQKTGMLLPLLQEACEDGYKESKSPEDIISGFLTTQKEDLNEQERIDFLFRVIQYVERQVVLVDALEDAAYPQIHHMEGSGSWHQMAEKLEGDSTRKAVQEILTDIGIRVVLTAHPTQFYPKTVLSIISDLSMAIREGNSVEIRLLLEQLGRTPFFRKRAPTPHDEAMQLISHLKHVFYSAVGDLLDEIARTTPETTAYNHDLIRLGFWPGGDRDGNPNITADTTRQVAAELKRTLLSKYYQDIKQLTRRLSFEGVHEKLTALRRRLQKELGRLPSNMNNNSEKLTLDQFNLALEEIEELLEKEHSSLYLDLFQSFRRKVNSFGFHFASLDLRQDSRVIQKTLDHIVNASKDLLPATFKELSSGEQIEHLFNITGEIDPGLIEDPILRDTAESIRVIHDIQALNGEAGAHRFIISNSRSGLDIARLYAIFKLCGGPKNKLTIDLVPLFETVDDLNNAAETMSTLYSSPIYIEHLAQRQNMQTVMLGFSDGTKDGGYFMANWGIYSAKEAITRVSRDEGVEVVFFDGRGGPPSRGGGETHLFYTAQSHSVANREIQITIQGQTVSSSYGIREAAMHNLELLLTAGIKSRLLAGEETAIDDQQSALMDEIARASYDCYRSFKEHPLFIPYLLNRSPLKYYGQTNIASRPTQRNQSDSFSFEDLRAIPFVGAWSQIKQNVPGFYGLGTALKELEKQGRLNELIDLFHKMDLFRAIITNSMQSMSKSNFDLTRYMEKDAEFGEFWCLIHDEFELTLEMVLKVSGQSRLLEDNHRSRRSIHLREKIVLPVLTIQQYALMKLQDPEISKASTEQYDKMVLRSLFGIINATRNSV